MFSYIRIHESFWCIHLRYFLFRFNLDFLEIFLTIIQLRIMSFFLRIFVSKTLTFDSHTVPVAKGPVPRRNSLVLFGFFRFFILFTIAGPLRLFSIFYFRCSSPLEYLYAFPSRASFNSVLYSAAFYFCRILI